MKYQVEMDVDSQLRLGKLECHSHIITLTDSMMHVMVRFLRGHLTALYANGGEPGMITIEASEAAVHASRAPGQT